MFWEGFLNPLKGGVNLQYYNCYSENGAGPSTSRQGKKLVITDEYFQRVTRALVMRLRQHEETVTPEGTQLCLP